MNWVEEKHEREQAIADGAIYLWENLCAELKNCVESYNNLYGTETVRPVECEAKSGTIEIRRLVSAGDSRHSQFTAESKIDISLEHGGQPSIKAIRWTGKPGLPGTVTGPAMSSQEFVLDADMSGVFMTDKEGKKIALREASKLILNPFLFG